MQVLYTAMIHGNDYIYINIYVYTYIYKEVELVGNGQMHVIGPKMGSPIINVHCKRSSGWLSVPSYLSVYANTYGEK